MAINQTARDHTLLLDWYREHRRELPWRKNRDPYRIWISEIMLQQTTVTAVIPFYERFMSLFPNVQKLAAAEEGEVLRAWAGLGYYSRARNLHKAAKVLAQTGFPKTAAELIELPGFGPYTSAAVASIAFGDPVGVLDGNVIRVLSRRYALDLPWWNSSSRLDLQNRATAFAQVGQPDEINQAMMELGATVCTPTSPSCLICPWTTRCEARALDRATHFPRQRPRKTSEVWTWSPEISIRKGRVALVLNEEGPVLKGQWIFPGLFQKQKTKPKKFHARHGITHHDLFLQVTVKDEPAPNKVKWIPIKDLESVNPSKLLRKALDIALESK